MPELREFRIHLFEVTGESVLYVRAQDLQEAQNVAMEKAADLEFTKSRAKYLAVAFDELTEVKPDKL
jgi:hypothetical protein